MQIHRRRRLTRVAARTRWDTPPWSPARWRANRGWTWSKRHRTFISNEMHMRPFSGSHLTRHGPHVHSVILARLDFLGPESREDDFVHVVEDIEMPG